MSPKEQNIFNTVNLIAFLWHARKENNPKLSDEEKSIVAVKQEHLDKASITLPIFHNTLKLLHQKGYLMAVSIVDDDFHAKAKEFVDDSNYEEILSKIENTNSDFLTPEGKEKLSKELSALVPPQYHFDKVGFEQEKVTIKHVLDDTLTFLKNHNDEIVSYVMLWHFRNIETLLEKLNDGESFDQIQDAGVWYDPQSYEFHIGNDVVKTSYQGKPNIEHDILILLEDRLNDGVIGYDEVDEHKPSSLKSNLQKFIKKNDRLKEIFIVRTDRLEFDKKAFN